MEDVRGSGSASRAEAAPAEGQRGGGGGRCTAAEDPSSARGLAERRSSPPEAQEGARPRATFVSRPYTEAFHIFPPERGH